MLFFVWRGVLLILDPPRCSLTKGLNVHMYVHVLAMMNYLGFHNVIERLQRILRILARGLQPDSKVPKYIPGPPDSDDEDDTWDAEVPAPGQ